MQMRNTNNALVIWALLLLFPITCGAQGVRCGNVTVEALSEKIFHVTVDCPHSEDENEKSASAPYAGSLVVVPQTPFEDYTVERTDNYIRLRTTSAEARIDSLTGNVTFTDSAGNGLLSESGRAFEKLKNEHAQSGNSLYSVTQSFLFDRNEGLYGLGQHQSDEFNYIDKSEELFQYNTKVSVPFIVSTKGYGLLWDSYSLCRFGDVLGYGQLHRVLRLYDKEGKAGALTGTYVSGNGKQSAASADRQTGDDQSPQTIVRREDSLYFEDIVTTRNLPAGFPLRDATVTYEGEIEAETDGIHRFILYYAGYVRVYFDDQPVVPERWRTAWNPNSYKFAIDMKVGRRVKLRVEWRPDGGESYCGLRVAAEQQPRTERQTGLVRSWWGEAQERIDYYFICGDDIDDVISGYRKLTGKARIMPRWALGFWQSRERYKTQDELLATLNEFRRRSIPIDNIVQDWSYWPENAWGSHEFDPLRYPNPKAMVDSVHSLHARLMISVWPKFYTTTEHYREFDRQGWMYRRAVTDSLRDWIGPGYHYSFYDAYSEGARKLFWRQMRDHLYPLGIDAWWMDASEPNVRDCTNMDYRKALCGPTALGTSTQYLNAYSLMNAQAIYEGQREADADRRVFLLTRSGFAGQQRYSTATWSGDIASRWEDMKAQIPAGLNMGMSGLPYWTMDIGGFCVERRYERAYKHFLKTGEEDEALKEWRELNARWYQFGSFCPLYRAHGQFPPREIWNIAPEGHPCYESMTYYTRLRYRLMPYIYTLAGMTHFNDYTIMRALVMDFACDSLTYDIGDQYMFGPSLLVAPVYEYGARGREVYLPAGCGWYNFYSGDYYEGGQSIRAAAPYERIPLFVRAGAIIPMGPDMQYTDEKPTERITLYVYEGADGCFTLYEDDGLTYDYELGHYAVTDITYRDADGTLTISPRRGSYEGMPQSREYDIVRIKRK